MTLCYVFRDNAHWKANTIVSNADDPLCEMPNFCLSDINEAKLQQPLETGVSLWSFIPLSVIVIWESGLSRGLFVLVNVAHHLITSGPQSSPSFTEVARDERVRMHL